MKQLPNRRSPDETTTAAMTTTHDLKVLGISFLIMGAIFIRYFLWPPRKR